MPGVELLAALLVGYLIGAVPSGVLVGRLRGIDPRTGGSGRTGTTNALRTLGARWAAVVALLDVAKGLAAVLVGNAIGPEPWAGALAGVLAVVVALVEFAIIVWRTRFVSLGSIMAAVTVAVVSAALFSVGWVGAEAVVAAALIGFVVVVSHADNIARLRAGTERRLGRD